MSPMAQKILELVTTRQNVTFAELIHNIDGFDGGNLEFGIGKNVVLWSGLTQQAADAMEELRREGLIYPRPTSPLTYLIDGCFLKYPLVKSRRPYKKPHWLPVVFNPGPDPLIETMSAQSKATH